MKKGETLIYIASILISFVILAVNSEDAEKVGFLGLMLFSGNIATYFSSFIIKKKKADSNDVAYEQEERWHLGRLFDSRDKRASLTSAVIAVCYVVLTETLAKKWQVKILSAVLIIAINMNALVETYISDLTYSKKVENV
ncbi:MAG: hypothetical protein IKE52_01380 [Mogibacterium sp.]|nr:hypothetical protein [Mogibacterium sp.]